MPSKFPAWRWNTVQNGKYMYIRVDEKHVSEVDTGEYYTICLTDDEAKEMIQSLTEMVNNK